jgi:hypothetical protein
MDNKIIETMKRYYGNPAIRESIISQSKQYDFALGTGQVLIDRGWTFPVREVTPERVTELMDDGLDIFFPLRTRDEKFFYILWDIEYFNTKNKKFIFDRNNQRMIFEWMAPTLALVEDVLKSFGIRYVIDTTMSGVHVWSKISTNSPAFREISGEGMVLPSLAEKYSKVVEHDRKRNKPMPKNFGLAYNASGKLLEFFTHILIKKNNASNPFKIPVTVSDTPQLAEYYPYSGVSSDLTQYAHPLYMRCMRAIGSLHQKSVINGFPEMGAAIDIVKKNGMTYSDILDIMWNADAAVKYFSDNYASSYVDIPDASQGWLNAVRAYKKSALRARHKEWENTPAATDAPDFKIPCISRNFDEASANPSLLIPGNLQFLAEYFGEHYGVAVTKKVFFDIARNYYMNNKFSWYDPVRYTGIDWSKYDADTAVDFWGRIYWSQNVMGLGRGTDCDIVKKIGGCPVLGDEICRNCA